MMDVLSEENDQLDYFSMTAKHRVFSTSQMFRTSIDLLSSG